MKKFIERFSILAAFLAIGWSSAAAETIDASTVTTFELGKAYSIGMFKDFHGTIELPAGKVDVYNMPEGWIATDEDGNNPLASKDSGYGTLICEDGTECYGQIFKFDVPQAGTYYFSNFGEWIMDSRNFGLQAEGSQPIAYTEVMPAIGSTVSSTVNSSGSGYLVVYFNVPVTYTSAYIECNGNTSPYVTPLFTQHVTNLNVQLSDLMKYMYTKGAFSADGGTPFNVIIQGISDESGNLFGEAGTLVLNFVAGPKLMTLVSATMNSMSIDGQEFSSYWAKDSESMEAPGVFVFTFDHKLATDLNEERSAYLEISCGNIETESAYYYEKILPSKIVNSDTQGTLYFDLRDVSRRDALLSIGSSNAFNGAPVGVKLCQVTDEDGNLPEPVFDANGNVTNVGSYPYTMMLKIVPEQLIDFEFTPATGSSLINYDVLELWHNNLNAIVSFDGILFTYPDNTTELIAASALENISTENNEATYQIPIPARAKTAPVEVSMSNIVAIDGYVKKISAAYNQFVVTECSPFQEGGRYAEIPADPWLTGDNTMTERDKLIHARTNYYPKYPALFMKYSIDDITNPKAIMNLHSSDMKKLDNDEFVGCAMNHAQDLYYGHTYAITFYAWETEGDYNYGKESLGSYSITFYGTAEAFKYSDINFVSISPDPNDGAIAPSQNEFIVTYDGLVKLNGYTGVPGGMGTGLKKVDSTAVDADPENNGYSAVWKIIVPEDYMTGTALDLQVGAVDVNGLTVEGDIQSMSEIEYKSFSFIIEDNTKYVELFASPADGSTVTEISEIKLTANAALGINWTYSGPGIEIYNKTRELVHTLALSDNENASEIFVEAAQQVDSEGNLVFDELNNPVYSELTYIALRLKEPITSPGGYMISIPEAYFMAGSQFVTNYNQATNITLTIGSEPEEGEQLEIAIVPTEGDKVVAGELKEVIIYTKGEINPECVDPITIACAMDWDAYQDVTGSELQAIDGGYSIQVTVESIPTTLGDCTIGIPSGFFTLGTSKNPDTYVTFTIVEGEPATGLSTLLGDKAESYEVYDLLGVKILSVKTADELGVLGRGLFIINGKKFLIK